MRDARAQHSERDDLVPDWRCFLHRLSRRQRHRHRQPRHHQLSAAARKLSLDLCPADFRAVSEAPVSAGRVAPALFHDPHPRRDGSAEPCCRQGCKGLLVRCDRVLRQRRLRAHRRRFLRLASELYPRFDPRGVFLAPAGHQHGDLLDDAARLQPRRRRPCRYAKPAAGALHPALYRLWARFGRGGRSAFTQGISLPAKSDEAAALQRVFARGTASRFSIRCSLSPHGH